MTPIQTSYSERMRPAIAGMIANEEENNTISRTASAAAGVEFGVAVSRGANDSVCVAYATGSTVFLGFSVRERSVRPDTPNKFGQYESVRIMTMGVIWVNAKGAVTQGADVYINPTTGALGVSGSGLTQLPGCEWDSSTTGDGLARIRIK